MYQKRYFNQSDACKKVFRYRGYFNGKDALRLVDLYSELSELELQMSKRGASPNAKQEDPKEKKLGGKVAMARREIVNLESAYQSLFNHTADIKAQNRVILWYILHLAYLNTDTKEDTHAPLFEGRDFESRIDDYYKKDEDDDELFRLVQSKLAALISYWYFSEKPTQEDFDNIINDLDS